MQLPGRLPTRPTIIYRIFLLELYGHLHDPDSSRLGALATSSSLEGGKNAAIDPTRGLVEYLSLLLAG